MDDSTLHCYSLNRGTPRRQRHDVTLPGDIHHCLSVLALFLETRGIAQPMPLFSVYALPGFPFVARRLLTGELVAAPINHDQNAPRLLRWVHYWLTPFRRAKCLAAVPEIVIEIFATGDGNLRRGPLPVGVDDSLLLLRLHFWERDVGCTYVRAFFGWHDAIPKASHCQLTQLAESFLQQAQSLFGEQNQDPALLSPVSSAPEPNVQEQTAAAPILSGPPPPGNGVPRPAVDVISNPPRIYARSLAKICRMVCRRQRQIEDGQRIQDIEVMRSQIGPSINTLRKLPELVSNWEDGHYRWHADTWLREQSGHAPAEVAKLLSELRGKLTPADWSVVMAGSGGESAASSPPFRVESATMG